MSPSRAALASLPLAALLLAAPALAHDDEPRFPGRAGLDLQGMAAGLGLTGQDAPVAPVAGEPVGAEAVGDETPIPSVEELVNFNYGDIIERREQVYIRVGRGRRARTVPNPRSGVTVADRVSRGEVNQIVLHASLGAGTQGGCAGSVNYLLQARQAAHFMVCRSGQVYRMADIADIALHVRNDDVKAHSVGIETDSGHLKIGTDRRGRRVVLPATDAETFLEEDWNPSNYWIMYASLAGVIRAVAHEARVPRDAAHIRTHREVDLGEVGGHTDPGDLFDGRRGFVYPEFAQRYPGENLSPYQWLMRLVQDDAPPSIVSVIGANGGVTYRVRDTNNLGLAYVRVYKVNAPGAPRTKLSEWAAMPGTFPDAMRDVTPPTEPGSYNIIARDLVGNIFGVELTVEPPAVAASGRSAMRALSGVQLASYEEPGYNDAVIRTAFTP